MLLGPTQLIRKLNFKLLFSGGGFRDSLADIAEELCPSSSETPIPLTFFIRSPNQVCVSTSLYILTQRESHAT